jgi:MFS family permease
MTATPTLDSIVLPLQLAGSEQRLSQVIGQILSFLPVILSAIVILAVGLVVGRLLEAIVVRVLQGIGLSDYTGGTALETSGEEGADSNTRSGKVAAFYVYFVAILAADVLQIPVLSDLLAQISAFVPVVISAIVVLVLGFIVGRVIRDIIADLISGFNLGQYLRDTPLGRFADQKGEFGNIVGALVAYYVYFLTIVTAANILQIGVLSRLLSQFAGYLPTLIGGLAVLIAGILIGDFVGGLVANIDGRRITDIFGVAAKVFIYYMTATLTLNTIGFATDVLTKLV